jgi:hypothetical protein
LKKTIVRFLGAVTLFALAVIGASRMFPKNGPKQDHPPQQKNKRLWRIILDNWTFKRERQWHGTG